MFVVYIVGESEEFITGIINYYDIVFVRVVECQEYNTNITIAISP